MAANIKGGRFMVATSTSASAAWHLVCQDENAVPRAAG
jgi:hypothetical protein